MKESESSLFECSSIITIAIGRRFPLGRVYITANAFTEISPYDYLAALRCHNQGDGGELKPQDQRVVRHCVGLTIWLS